MMPFEASPIPPIFYAPGQLFFWFEPDDPPAFSDSFNLGVFINDFIMPIVNSANLPYSVEISQADFPPFHFTRRQYNEQDPPAANYSLYLANISSSGDGMTDLKRVGDIGNAINTHLHGQSSDGAVPWQQENLSFMVKPVSPNWLMGAAQTGHLITGGPGTLPEPATKEEADHYPGFDIDPLLPQIESPVEVDGQAHVFILDNAPSLCGQGNDTLEGAYNQLRAQNASGHPLYRLVNRSGDPLVCAAGAIWNSDGGKLEIVPASVLGSNAANLARLGGQSGTESSYILHGHYWQLTNHGLFVSGLIRCISPDVHLHLLEVLNPYGLGTLSTLLASFQHIQKYIIANPNARILINCSMTFGIFTEKDLETVAAEFPSGFEYLLGLVTYIADFGMLLGSICQVFDPLTTFIVASAGNESRQGTPVRETRYPAKFSYVAGVGAMQSDNSTRAAYSNFADEPVEKGVMVFGGDIQAPTSTNTEAQPPMLGANSLIGLYIGDFPDRNAPFSYAAPPPDAPLYQARWAGTSFAAAIVSGVIAELYARGAEATLSEVFSKRLVSGSRFTSENEVIYP